MNFDHNGQELEFDIFGEYAIWSILRKYGFISMIGEDDCDFRFPESFGRRPRVDHVVRNFYCAAYNFIDLGTDKFATK